MNYFVYILTNWNRTVLYTGVTNDLERRLEEHKSQAGGTKTFTGRYLVTHLIYWERHPNVNHAIEREKEIKKWRREKKLDLIRTTNPNFQFLNNEI